MPISSTLLFIGPAAGISEDGFWNVSLGDPNDFGGPETTGTSLFLYGFAWGVKKGVLPARDYLPALAKGTAGEAIVEGLKGIGEIDSPRGPWRFSDGHGPEQTYYLRNTEKQGGRIVNAVVQPLTGS